MLPDEVTLTSMLSPAAAEPDPLVFEQLPLLAALTVNESSVTPVVLSMTATVAVSVPLTFALVSAYRLVTVAPLAGVGPANRPLFENPIVFAGQGPVPGPASSA